MKKLWKRNQIMITALALMIAIAGYLNFMGKKVDEEICLQHLPSLRRLPVLQRRTEQIWQR